MVFRSFDDTVISISNNFTHRFSSLTEELMGRVVRLDLNPHSTVCSVVSFCRSRVNGNHLVLSR